MVSTGPLACALLAAVRLAISTVGGCIGAETRVRGIDLALRTVTQGIEAASAGTHLGIGYHYGETASDRANQYNGRVFDPGTGFHDYGARMYWPQIGRFISADSYQGDIARPASLNRYSYVLNNPYRYTDPTGHQEREDRREEEEARPETRGRETPPALAQAGFWSSRNPREVFEHYAQEWARLDPTVTFIGGSNPDPTLEDVLWVIRGAIHAGAEPPTTLEPGPFAKDGVPARGPDRDFTRAERDAVNAQGICHTCGSSDPGTKSGDFDPDHQRANGLAKPGEPQRLYPQCLTCARRQGGEVNAEKTRKE